MALLVIFVYIVFKLNIKLKPEENQKPTEEQIELERIEKERIETHSRIKKTFSVFLYILIFVNVVAICYMGREIYLYKIKATKYQDIINERNKKISDSYNKKNIDPFFDPSSLSSSSSSPVLPSSSSSSVLPTSSSSSSSSSPSLSLQKKLSLTLPPEKIKENIVNTIKNQEKKLQKLKQELLITGSNDNKKFEIKKQIDDLQDIIESRKEIMSEINGQ
jgi:hypothetical protein